MTSEWYRKDTATNVGMNSFAKAPMKYQTNIVSGLINRIWDSCSSYKAFADGLDRARKLLEKNQYSRDWVDTKIGKAVEKGLMEKNSPRRKERTMCKNKNATEERVTKMYFLNIKGLKWRNKHVSCLKLKLQLELCLYWIN